jgi:protein-S-isoprenylcysteine O-methyltransferase Ste14
VHDTANSIVLALWVGIFILWAITGAATKETVRSRSEGRARIAVWMVWLAWWLLLSRGFGRPPLSERFMPPSATAISLGVILTIVGHGLAVWARLSIGRNWSPMIEMKKDHELKQRGPYGIVRHPIYSGFMLATLGTALVYGAWSGVVAVVLIAAGWGYKARLEENALREQFGEEYDRYARRVKGLIPFLY